MLSRVAFHGPLVLLGGVGIVLAAVVLQLGSPAAAVLRIVASLASGEPLVLLRRVLLELVHGLLLIVVFRMLVKVARGVGVVVATVHAEGATPVSVQVLLLLGLITSIAHLVPHLLETSISEVLSCAAVLASAVLIVVECSLGACPRVSAC